MTSLRSRLKTYFLGLLVWILGVLVAHLGWRLCFIQTQANIVSVESYEKKYRSITHTHLLISYSYTFNDKKLEGSDTEFGGDQSRIENRKSELRTTKTIPIYVNRFDPNVSYQDLFWGIFWPLLNWMGLILALPTAYVTRFFLKKFSK